MNAFKNWFAKRFSDILSFIGFLLTIYFGFFYVPDYIKEANNEKLKSVQYSLQQSIKELVYSDAIFTVKEFESLLRAKEVTLQEKFPLSKRDILTKVQESFMEDRFLSLSKRKELLEEIQRIKDRFPIEKSKQEEGIFKSYYFSTIISFIITLLISIFGILSFFRKYQNEKEKEEELNNELANAIIQPNKIETFFQYQNDIEIVLKRYVELKWEKNEDLGIDFIFSHKEKNYFVEVKYLLKTKVGLGTVTKLMNSLNYETGEIWLVHNTDVTAMVRDAVEQFNKKNKAIKFKLVHAKNAQEFEKQLDQLLN